MPKREKTAGNGETILVLKPTARESYETQNRGYQWSNKIGTNHRKFKQGCLLVEGPPPPFQ